MSQQITLTATSIGAGIGSQAEYIIIPPSGLIDGATTKVITSTEAQNGVTVELTSNTINYVTIVVNGGGCTGTSKDFYWGSVATPTPTPTPTEIIYPETATPTTTVPTTTVPTTTPCPNVITVSSGNFGTFTNASTSASLGGWCMSTPDDTEGEIWYIDENNSSSPSIYIWGFSGGSNSSCPNDANTDGYTPISSFEDITPGLSNTLYNTGLQWADSNNQEHYVIIETADQDRTLVNVYLVPTCYSSSNPATPTPTPTPTPTTVAYGLRRCDDSTTTWYTTSITNASSLSSGDLVYSNSNTCYRSEGVITSTSGRSDIGTVTVEDFFNPVYCTSC